MSVRVIDSVIDHSSVAPSNNMESQNVLFRVALDTVVVPVEKTLLYAAPKAYPVTIPVYDRVPSREVVPDLEGSNLHTVYISAGRDQQTQEVYLGRAYQSVEEAIAYTPVDADTIPFLVKALAKEANNNKLILQISPRVYSQEEYSQSRISSAIEFLKSTYEVENFTPTNVTYKKAPAAVA